MKIYVNDKMQKGYVYETTEPEGINFAKGFEPELTPKQMLMLGVFEGRYLNDCRAEFPKDWFEGAKLSEGKADVTKNCFGVKSRQDLDIWRKKGWIIEPDVRGWFQWYCRYYMGRRIEGVDKIQIKRWKAFRRHKVQLERNCAMMDFECRKKQRQALLQWAYNPFF